MELLDALLALKEKAIKGVVEYPNYGICFNLSELINSVDLSHDFVRDNCKGWKHFSGDTSYPIKDYDLGGLWEGEQLELRLSLLDHLITKAKLYKFKAKQKNIYSFNKLSFNKLSFNKLSFNKLRISILSVILLVLLCYVGYMVFV